jgi:acyl-CoA thioesterase-1
MNVRLLIVSVLVLAACGFGCEREDPPARASQSDPPPAARPGADRAPDPAPRPAKLPRVVFLGDSLTAGLGVDAEQAFPALVGEALRRESRPVDVVNAGVSGDTTAGGLRRLDWLLRQKPDVVVVGLGGNDGLRGLKLEASEQNLRAIVRKSRDAGASVLLLGMLIPPNYGPEYTSQFRDVYPRVAKETGAALVPFLLDGVGGDPRLNQPDGIHPTAEGHRIIAGTVVNGLRPLLPVSPPVPPPVPAP